MTAYLRDNHNRNEKLIRSLIFNLIYTFYFSILLKLYSDR